MLINNLTDGYVMNFSTMPDLVTFSSIDSTGLVIFFFAKSGTFCEGIPER